MDIIPYYTSTTGTMTELELLDTRGELELEQKEYGSRSKYPAVTHSFSIPGSISWLYTTVVSEDSEWHAVPWTTTAEKRDPASEPPSPQWLA